MMVMMMNVHVLGFHFFQNVDLKINANVHILGIDVGIDAIHAQVILINGFFQKQDLEEEVKDNFSYEVVMFLLFFSSFMHMVNIHKRRKKKKMQVQVESSIYTSCKNTFLGAL